MTHFNDWINREHYANDNSYKDERLKRQPARQKSVNASIEVYVQLQKKHLILQPKNTIIVT